MIAQNEINVQWGLANKTDNGIVSYKHYTGRGFSYKLSHGACTIIPYPTVEVKLFKKFMQLVN